MANEFRIKNGLIVDQGTSQLTGSFLVSGSVNISGSGNQVPFQISSGSTPLLFVSQSSNVGIGTAIPAVPLEIGRTSGGTQAKLRLWSGNTQWAQLEGGDSYLDYNLNGIYSAVLSRNGGQRFTLTSDSVLGWAAAVGSSSPVGANTTTLSKWSTGAIAVGSGSTSNASGSLIAKNIGAGTLIPNANLDVNGSAIVTGSLTVTNGITGSLFGTSSWAVSASSALSAPLYLPLTGGTISGNLTVIGTSSFAYTTSSVVQVGASTITLNTNNPATRFGGITVIDSGSFGNSSTGSLFWDSLNNRWIYSNPSGSSYDGGMLISGPRNTSGLGNEQGTANNYITKGQGGDHITSSMIYEDSSGRVGIGTTSPILKLEVSGSDISANGVQIGRGGGYLDTNTAVGYQAVSNNTTGTDNTGIGRGAIYFNSIGIQNTAVGYRALYSTNGGSSNTAVGHSALLSNTTGDSNTAVGIGTLNNNTTGYENTALGHSAGYSLTTGFKNTFIGRSAGTSATTAQYSTVIGGYLTPGNSTFNENETLSIERPDATVNSYLGESAGLPHFWAPATQYVGDGGTGVMLTLQSTAYSAFFMDYNVEDLNTNMRAGTIKAIWTYDGSSIKVTEETTDSIGTTSGIVIAVTYSSGTIQVTIDNNNGYGAYYNLTSRLLIRPTILNF